MSRIDILMKGTLGRGKRAGGREEGGVDIDEPHRHTYERHSSSTTSLIAIDAATMLSTTQYAMLRRESSKEKPAFASMSPNDYIESGAKVGFPQLP